MPPTVPDSSSGSLRDRLEDIHPTMAKARKKVEQPWREQVGLSIDRAISFAGLTQKEVWVLLGHSNGAQLNRWIAGTERPQFDALFALPVLQKPLVIALAKLAACEVVTEIRVSA